MSNKQKIAVGISGASGMIYAQRLLERMQMPDISADIETSALVFSKNASQIWNTELGKFDSNKFAVNIYDNSNFNAPFASGSARYDTLIVCPCSMGTLGKIASGISDSLITRAADVMLKERKRLILVTRETPVNLIHIKNMETVTLAGGIIFPASPSFYHHHQTLTDIIDTVVNRVLDLAGFNPISKRWQTN